MPGDADTLPLIEILLTAEVFNQNPQLDINDLTPKHRVLFNTTGNAHASRPLVVSDGLIKRGTGIPEASKQLKGNPFISVEDFGQRMSITTLDAAARWFLQQGGQKLAVRNPTLAFYYERQGLDGITYAAARAQNPPFEDTRTYLNEKLIKITGEDERFKLALDLVIVNAPEEVDQYFDALVLTSGQEEMLKKIGVAMQHREILSRHRIHEVGKLLFVGPPGTGKTSLALALSRELHMPLIEVRLSMVTSQYLGETSKNIDRIFDLARKLSPAIVFIDEFDFVAKSRVSDDHGAMKRAVNTLLKNIDQVSLVKNSVLLICATNHPQLLDEAAWRRFDEVVEFGLPDEEMRKNILKKITGTLECSCDYQQLAHDTDGFSGSDLRMMVKEALLSALSDKRTVLGKDDVLRGIFMVKNRDALRKLTWQG